MSQGIQFFVLFFWSWISQKKNVIQNPKWKMQSYWLGLTQWKCHRTNKIHSLIKKMKLLVDK
jgi:hypothetical protein